VLSRRDFLLTLAAAPLVFFYPQPVIDWTKWNFVEWNWKGEIHVNGHRLQQHSADWRMVSSIMAQWNGHMRPGHIVSCNLYISPKGAPNA